MSLKHKKKGVKESIQMEPLHKFSSKVLNVFKNKFYSFYP